MRLDNFGPVVFFCSHTTYAMFVGGLGLDVFILQGDARSYNFLWLALFLSYRLMQERITTFG